MNVKKKDNKMAWVVAVNMGYGHQRTAYPLKHLAPAEIVINANDYEEIPKKDRRIWEGTRKFYEFISRSRRLPVIGNAVFSTYDKFQKIFTFYPKRDLSKPNFSLKRIASLIKKGWGRDLMEKLKIENEKLKTNLPFVSTFFTTAFMAEIFNYPGEIYCIICDADIARTWASLKPPESRIKYFAPCNWVVERLKLYGVKEENIFLTGYPLPKENIGKEKMEILKEDLRYRLLNLDPQKKYYEQYKPLIDKYLGKLPEKTDHPLTIMFSVGGAGAQKEIVSKYLKALIKEIKAGTIKIILSCGIRENVKEYFLKNIKKLGLENNLKENIDPVKSPVKSGEAGSPLAKFNRGAKQFNGVEILFAQNIEEYFREFNQKLRKTDILWTKPSELSFYIALGLPILLAPTLGSQEDFNRRWLLKMGSAILGEDPDYAGQWFFDYLNSGRFAEAAMEGFIEAEKLGTYKIEQIISQNLKPKT